MTKIIKKLPISAEQLSKFKEDRLKNWIEKDAGILKRELGEIVSYINKKISDVNTWIYMPNKNVYYIPSIVSLMPDLDKFDCKYTQANYPIDVKTATTLEFSGFQGIIPSEYEAKKCFNSSLRYFKDGRYIKTKAGNKDGLYFYKAGKYYYQYNIYQNYSVYIDGTGACNDFICYIPIYRFNGVNSPAVSAGRTLFFWLQADIIPDDEWFDSEDLRRLYKTLINLYKANSDYIIADENTISLDINKIYDDIIAGKKVDLMVQDTKSLLETTTIEADESYIDNLKKELLECDYNRALLDKYDENILLDPNRGHWDLWDYNSDVEAVSEITLPEGLTARNPADDINHGIVGIDFGTKSTVVVYENEHLQTLPLQVGSGSYGKGVQAKNYENPTVIEFIDIESFVKAYNSRAGRPNTSWNDITVSHTAFNDLSNSDSSAYYAFFDSIKQWCGSDNQRVKLKDKRGHIEDLPPFMELTENSINPVEIYAYYLGLYINNMLQEKHIFLQYIMSFPVTYDRGIREKMRRSFDAGIRKSLPTALLSNEEAMKHFIVQEGVSEPAAYAITALEEYEFNPCDDEENYYAVFDFGGGTTDFDFGVLRGSEQDRYDYTLLHFGANGDRTLGGENLLSLLAFEVFKANKDKLLKPKDDNSGSKIPFTWAAEKKDFAGSEGLIKDSQEAKLNMHNLMEVLRKIWEAPDSEETQKMLDAGTVTVNLFTDQGEPLTTSLDIVDKDKNSIDLVGILQNRIEKGVKNFFIALREAFDKSSGDEHNIKALSDVDGIAIFLAGNSSKSEIVKTLFDEYIGEDGKARELLGFAKEQKMPVFKLYPALGTEDAYKLKEELGLDAQRDNLEKPTGKTGVAFGLLKCRESGTIKVIDITPDKTKVQFQYYVGRKKKRKFKTVIDRNTKMEQWYKFIDASASFDLLYTDAPIAATNEAPATIAKQIHVPIEKPNPEAYVFVRPINSNTIEYTVAKDLDELNSNVQVEPKAISLE